MKVFVVSSSFGYYEDQRSNNVAVFDDEDKAVAEVARIEACYKDVVVGAEILDEDGYCIGYEYDSEYRGSRYEAFELK